MRITDLRKAAAAAIAGGILWAFGLTGAVLGELDYRGLTDNPIPDALTGIAAAVGSALFLLAFISLRRGHKAQGATGGAPGYWITIVGLALTLVPIWPFIAGGPMVLALGATIYAAATLASGKVRSFGLWLHALCIPAGVVVGFGFAWGGYDGGIGLATLLLMLITGFMAMAYDAAYSAPPVGAQVPVETVTA